MVAEVIVDIAHSDVDKIFDYFCEENILPGMMVSVPFGQMSSVTGFVMRVKEKSDYPEEKMKKILRAEIAYPVLTAESLQLAEKLANRYKTPKASVLRLFLPAEMRSGKAKEYYRRFAVVKGDPPAFSGREKKQKETYDFIADNGEVDTVFLQNNFGSSYLTLAKKGYIEIVQKRVMRSPYSFEQGSGRERTLKPAQEIAMRTIERTEKTVTLIHGVTGSGKTEVYLNLIAKQLEKGKNAIFLVPEISLTPQMLSQLRARFGSSAAILHSGLSAGERFDEWCRLREGSAKIAIGARSAIFAPLENLGVVIIDEEHDGSYLSESSPRYSTFDVAYLRARYNGCKLVLGSATPSVETYRRAKEGEFELVRMPDRINARPLPDIHIADMRQEVRRGNISPFSSALRDKLNECLEEGNQAIVFLNRRGYSQTVVCRNCGYVAKCEHCDVSLTYHSEEDCLKCHYCGTKYYMLSACPECGGKHIGYVGTGTQKVVSELKKLYPKARILRMDNDTTSGKEGHYKILKEFSDRNADILVGTQMVAKGHDFPGVTLVGILDADMSLHFPDYRSGERTFQLITQVAGRSGRAEERGEVVLQTFDPENYILRYATAYDYEGFYEYEINLRAATAFPPFAKIVRVMVTSGEEKSALDGLKEVYMKLSKLYAENSEKFLFFQKMHSPIKRIENVFRYQVLMRLTDGSLLKEIYEICSEVKNKDALVYVEENPVNLS